MIEPRRPDGARPSRRSTSAIQFWTSRGFAVVDVNYGGSTGYGRAYRERLRRQLGRRRHRRLHQRRAPPGEQGEVDGAGWRSAAAARAATRRCARSPSTTLFAAGASYFGVARPGARSHADTHKFESRYLDGLIGPYPEAADVYRARSPIHSADRISCPVILFQGLEDEIVPPAQAEEMVAALRANGIPYAYLAFEGEQHGFRSAETIKRTLEAELYFYSRVFGFEPAETARAGRDPQPLKIPCGSALSPRT